MNLARFKRSIMHRSQHHERIRQAPATVYGIADPSLARFDCSRTSQNFYSRYQAVARGTKIGQNGLERKGWRARAGAGGHFFARPLNFFLAKGRSFDRFQHRRRNESTPPIRAGILFLANYYELFCPGSSCRRRCLLPHLCDGSGWSGGLPIEWHRRGHLRGSSGCRHFCRGF
jgi:hypothetical protein